jgi:hypothetical protein
MPKYLSDLKPKQKLLPSHSEPLEITHSVYPTLNHTISLELTGTSNPLFEYKPNTNSPLHVPRLREDRFTLPHTEKLVLKSRRALSLTHNIPALLLTVSMLTVFALGSMSFERVGKPSTAFANEASSSKSYKTQPPVAVILTKKKLQTGKVDSIDRGESVSMQVGKSEFNFVWQQGGSQAFSVVDGNLGESGAVIQADTYTFKNTFENLPIGTLINIKSGIKNWKYIVRSTSAVSKTLDLSESSPATLAILSPFSGLSASVITLELSR